MRKVKLGFVVAAFAALVGAGSVARASDVQGTVVCAGTGLPVADVQVTLAYGASVFSGLTGADGVFNIHVTPIYVTYALTIAGSPAGSFYVGFGLNPTPWLLDGDPGVDGIQPFAADIPGCSPPPPVECEALAGLSDGSFCRDHPLGNPKAECGYFGVVALDKDDDIASQTTPSEYDAALAIVKTGNCYNYYVDVTVGEILSSPSTSNISHVTYCSCQ